jgi:hypothetical protein
MSGRGRSGRDGRRSGLARVLAVLAGLAVVVHVFGLYRPTGPPSPSWFPDVDKVEHLLGFAAPVCLVLLALDAARPLRRRTPGATLLVVGAFALHAVVSELAQHFFYVHRTGDPLDALADGAGVALGWGLATLVRRHLPPDVAAGVGSAGSAGESVTQVPR